MSTTTAAREITLTTNQFHSIDGVRAANRSAGQHWFDRDTMRFFNSRISDCLYSGRLFVSSERMRYESSTPRRYTVRFVDTDAGIETLGEFDEFATSRQAHARIHRVVKAGHFWAVGYLENDQPKPIWFFECEEVAAQKLEAKDNGHYHLFKVVLK